MLSATFQASTERALTPSQRWISLAEVTLGTFIVIGLLSVPPTLAFLKWRRAGASPTDEAVAKVRR